MESRRIHFRSGGGLDLFFFNISRSVLIIVSLSCQILLPLLTSIVQQRVEILFGQPLAQQTHLPPKQSLTSKPVLMALLSIFLRGDAT